MRQEEAQVGRQEAVSRGQGEAGQAVRLSLLSLFGVVAAVAALKVGRDGGAQAALRGRTEGRG